MSFQRLNYFLTKVLTKKDFSLEVCKTEISHMDLLSTMRHCGSEEGFPKFLYSKIILVLGAQKFKARCSIYAILWLLRLMEKRDNKTLRKISLYGPWPFFVSIFHKNRVKLCWTKRIYTNAA